MDHSQAWNIYEIYLLIIIPILLTFIPGYISAIQKRKAQNEKTKWEKIISSRYKG